MKSHVGVTKESGEEGSLINMMNRISMILLSGAIGLSLTGCAATSPTMRGQSPGCGDCDGWGAMSRSEMRRAARGNCQEGCYGADRCLNLPCHPVHRNFYTYDVPRGLEYPQDNTPPAVVQYPYYTTRGPTDFFMK